MQDISNQLLEHNKRCHNPLDSRQLVLDEAAARPSTCLAYHRDRRPLGSRKSIGSTGGRSHSEIDPTAHAPPPQWIFATATVIHLLRDLKTRNTWHVASSSAPCVADVGGWCSVHHDRTVDCTIFCEMRWVAPFCPNI